MAPKSKFEQATKNNRIRFVMLEADLNDGNFSELTNAITQALRPTQPTTRLIAPTSATAAPKTLNVNGAATHVEDETPPEAEEELSAEEEAETPSVPRVPKPPKKYPMPDYKHDLDITGTGESFKDFTTRLAPKSILQKYLISTLWLRDFGQSPTIDIHKVYTCFRTAGWSTKINDWDASFRALKKVNKLRRTDDGSYAITPIGEADIHE